MSLTRAHRRLPALTAAATALTAGALLAPASVAQAAPTVPATGAATASLGAPVTASITSGTAAADAARAARVRQALLRNAALRKSLIGTAAKLKGSPYRYGATGPGAFDCSGYTRYVFARNGISLPRTSQAQYRAARRISKASARAGDLVFFGRGSSVYHVGIYAGNGKMWHSPRPGKTVRLVKIWTSAWSAGRVI